MAPTDTPKGPLGATWCARDTHAPHWGSVKSKKRGKWQKRLKMTKFAHIRHARRRAVGRWTQMHLTRKALGVGSRHSNPTEPPLWPSIRAQKQRNRGGVDFELAGLEIHAIWCPFTPALYTSKTSKKTKDTADTKAPCALLHVERHFPHLGGYAYQFIWPLALSFPGYSGTDFSGL